MARLLKEPRERKTRRLAILAPNVVCAPWRNRRHEEMAPTLAIEKGLNLSPKPSWGKNARAPKLTYRGQCLRASPLPTLSSLLGGGEVPF